LVQNPLSKYVNYEGHEGHEGKKEYPDHPNEKFLEVSEPFFKKVLTRRRQKLAVDLGRASFKF
jgi:hypothetical protein